MADILGADRIAVIARELTKMFETIRQGPLAELLLFLEGDSNQRKGEFVVLVQGKPAGQAKAVDEGTVKILKTLLEELPLKQAASLAAKITGVPKNRLYDVGLTIKEKQ
jgi:16S rRNA (cytidine1402-2'-O)-methyltransferase